MSLLDDLLARGFLPIQLPPGFSSLTFASQLTKFRDIWEKEKPLRTLGEKFSVARSSYYRRTTSIINPIGFYFLAAAIDKHWVKIEEHYTNTKISRSQPKTGGSIRAIELPRFSQLYEAKVTSAEGHKFALVTDITSFFPAIYTHTIPWALHTKVTAKESAKDKKRKRDSLFGNILDEYCMSVQDGQTIGIPIGPDTSHILAEIIATAIDEALYAELGRWPAGFRYVDDFYLFFDRREDAEAALAAVTRAVGGFELQINAGKTKIIEVRELVEESWKYSIKQLGISSAIKQQRDDVHHYFEVIFSLEKRFKDESLVKYGLKQLSSTIVKKSNWNVLEAYLFKCGYGFPNTIQTIVHILATYAHHEYPLNRDAISRFSANVILGAAAADHHGEVAWLLWLCKELSLNMGPLIVRGVEKNG